jgi:hypothetical protein
MTTTQLVPPPLSLPVPGAHLMVDCTTFLENPALAESPYAISSSLDVNRFRPFVDAIDGKLTDITNGNIPNPSCLAAEFGFV